MFPNSGSACRNKVLNFLRKRYKSPADYFPSEGVVDSEAAGAGMNIVPELQPSSIVSLRQLTTISDLYKSYVTSNSSVTLPDDFLKLALSAMEHLESCGRSNVLYNLAKALGTTREDGTDSLLPAKRMPMGLIEHCVNFFCSTKHQVLFLLTLLVAPVLLIITLT